MRGDRPERWIRQTNFDNDEAVGYLADRLARLGVEDALAKQGALPGAPVTIGDVTFEWEPSTPAGIAAVTHGAPRHRPAARTDTTGSAPPTASTPAGRGARTAQPWTIGDEDEE